MQNRFFETYNIQIVKEKIYLILKEQNVSLDCDGAFALFVGNESRYIDRAFELNETKRKIVCHTSDLLVRVDVWEKNENICTFEISKKIIKEKNNIFNAFIFKTILDIISNGDYDKNTIIEKLSRIIEHMVFNWCIDKYQNSQKNFMNLDEVMKKINKTTKCVILSLVLT